MLYEKVVTPTTTSLLQSADVLLYSFLVLQIDPTCPEEILDVG